MNGVFSILYSNNSCWSSKVSTFLATNTTHVSRKPENMSSKVSAYNMLYAFIIIPLTIVDVSSTVYVAEN